MCTSHPPHPPRRPYPPDPGPFPDESDAALAAQLKTPSWSIDLDPYPLAVLLQRHWQAVYDYASLCAPQQSAPQARTPVTADVGAAALTSAAVHQALRRLERSGPGMALRPRLLMTVREMTRNWVTPPAAATSPAAGRAESVDPAHRPSTRADRRLALWSFEAMPPTAQCLLWHTAVEAEPVSSPAALLALDIGTALTELQQARGQFRSGLLRAHRERASHDACRFYNRLLDIQTRRGRTLLPDVRQHLQDCAHCDDTAEQLGLLEGGIGELLAQAVLGDPAPDYLASRPGRRAPAPLAEAPASRLPWHRRGGRHRVAQDSPDPSHRAPSARVPAKALLTGVGLASALALGGMVTAVLWPAARDSTSGTDTTGDPVAGPARSDGTTAPAPPAVPPPRPGRTGQAGPALPGGPAGRDEPHDDALGLCPDAHPAHSCRTTDTTLDAGPSAADAAVAVRGGRAAATRPVRP